MLRNHRDPTEALGEQRPANYHTEHRPEGLVVAPSTGMGAEWVIGQATITVRARSQGTASGGRSQSTPPRRAASFPAAAAASDAPIRDAYAFVRGNVMSEV